jgi:hypothetical protein
MGPAIRFSVTALSIVIAVSAPTWAAESPKYGGTLTYMIPADAPPSFDGNRETTYATIERTRCRGSGVSG